MTSALHFGPVFVTLDQEACRWVWNDIRTAQARARRAGVRIPDEVLSAFAMIGVAARASDDGHMAAGTSPAKSPAGDTALASGQDRHDALGADELCPVEAAKVLGITPRHLRRLAQSGAIDYRRVGQRGYLFTPAALAAHRKRT